MPKIAWVLLPLAAYGVVLGVALLRSRLPARGAINVHTSLLLMIYLLATAGLGIFWVANQQLPVFDWHYLFGYSTVLLVTIHLCFNLPLALRALRGQRRPHRSAAGTRSGGNRVAAKGALAVGALAAAFFLGTRERATGALLSPSSAPSSAAAAGPAAAMIRFHELSSESRGSVFTRAPGIDWGSPPPAFKSYPDAPHIAFVKGSGSGGVGTLGLSAALRAAPGFQFRVRPLSMAELGDILFLGAGVTARRGGNALRAAPSSGALFSNELYVLARAVDGLARGVYHYDPERQRLDALGGLPAGSGAPSADDADAVIIATSVFRRTGYKYRDRAYRYVSADTGHLLENLRVAGSAAGMRAQPAARFDEAQLARAIGVDGVEEGVLAVMALRRGGAAAHTGPDPEFNPEFDPGLKLDRRSAARFVAPPVTAPPVAASPGLGLTGAVQQATSLRLAASPAAAPAPSAAALPPAQAALVPARRVITARRSRRRFGAGPVPLVALASILADMAQPPQLSDAIRVHVVVNRVDGLAPGVYRYRARHAREPHALEPQVLEPHALEPVLGGDFAAQAQSAALSQEAIGGAAVVLVLSAEREAMLAEGARGYRQGFLEAGMIGERWLLGAVARGLSACPVGAFYDDEAAALIGVDRRREWVLHFAALGVPAEQEAG
jgi:SagB-type dehydrogenase family enzyme